MKKFYLVICIGAFLVLTLVGCGGLSEASDCVILDNKTTSFDLYMYVGDAGNITPAQTITLGDMCKLINDYIKNNK